MTDRSSKLVRTTFGYSLLLGGLALAGCGGNPKIEPVPSKLRVFAADLQGATKTCEAPKPFLPAGQTTEVSTKQLNDGGWCDILLHQNGPKPYDYGLLTARPAHGTVVIHQVGDDTRIDYTPDAGFAGNDSYAVKLQPGDAVLHVTAVVTAAAAAAPAAPQAPKK
jgi:hypothetical protein